MLLCTVQSVAHFMRHLTTVFFKAGDAYMNMPTAQINKYIYTHFLSIVYRTQVTTIFVGKHRISYSLCCSDASQLFLPLNIVFYLPSSIQRFQYLLCWCIWISIHENTWFMYWLCNLMISIWFISIKQAFGRRTYIFFLTVKRSPYIYASPKLITLFTGAQH